MNSALRFHRSSYHSGSPSPGVPHRHLVRCAMCTSQTSFWRPSMSFPRLVHSESLALYPSFLIDSAGPSLSLSRLFLAQHLLFRRTSRSPRWISFRMQFFVADIPSRLVPFCFIERSDLVKTTLCREKPLRFVIPRILPVSKSPATFTFPATSSLTRGDA